jgi:ribonuclease-3
LLFDFFRRKRPKKLPSNLRDYLNRHISYRFHDTCLLEQAMTHRSYLQEGMERLISNERLEFLGDAVLGMVVTDELYHRFPEASEGELTRIKSTIVSREQLAKQARKIELGQFLFLGNGEEKSGGRRRPSILADGYEALLGAMYIDGGITEVRQFIRY